MNQPLMRLLFLFAVVAQVKTSDAQTTGSNFTKQQVGRFRVTSAIGQPYALHQQKINYSESLHQGQILPFFQSVKSTGAKISCFPNPVKNTLHLLAEETTAIRSVQLYDMNGKLILNRENDIPSTQLSLDLSHSPAGMYLISIEDSNGQSITQKITKSTTIQRN